MFRSLSEDDGGFVNEGFASDSCKVSGSNSYNFDDASSSTRIEIVRSKYDQQTLHNEMMYKKTPSKSSEFRIVFLKSDTRRVLKSKAKCGKIKGVPMALPLNRFMMSPSLVRTLRDKEKSNCDKSPRDRT